MKRLWLILLLCAAPRLAAGADWLHFRGTDNQSVAADPALPPAEIAADEAGAERNVAWKVPLPGRGVSSPIVIGKRVIATAASGANSDRLRVFCIDADTGKTEWERQFWATGRTYCHPTSSVAANTPASDGKRIYAMFSSNDLACLDLDGNLLWYRGFGYEMPTAANDVGMSASPLVLGDTVIVQVETKGESFAAGLDAATGETRWKIPRLAQMNWTSPSVWRGAAPAGDLVLLQSPDRLTAHEPRTGKLVWGQVRSCEAIPSPVAVGDIVYFSSSGLTAARRQGSNGEPEVAWSSNSLALSAASPVVDHDRLYTLNSSGVLLCADAASGDVKWKLRLKGPFWATPVIVGDRMYVLNQEGLAQVVRLGDTKGEIIAQGSFGEPVLGSPAVVDGAIYIRSDKHLWKFAGQ